jgi:hypothetical protein
MNTTGKKFGGRQKGSPNKTTKAVKEFLTDFFESNKEKAIEDYLKLSPKDRLNFFEKVIGYLTPKPTEQQNILVEYKHLEKLLRETPQEYLTEIENRLLKLNNLQNGDNDNE